MMRRRAIALLFSVTLTGCGVRSPVLDALAQGFNSDPAKTSRLELLEARRASLAPEFCDCLQAQSTSQSIPVHRERCLGAFSRRVEDLAHLFRLNLSLELSFQFGEASPQTVSDPIEYAKVLANLRQVLESLCPLPPVDRATEPRTSNPPG